MAERRRTHHGGEASSRENELRPIRWGDTRPVPPFSQGKYPAPPSPRIEPQLTRRWSPMPAPNPAPPPLIDPAPQPKLRGSPAPPAPAELPLLLFIPLMRPAPPPRKHSFRFPLPQYAMVDSWGDPI
eukprot:Polyplicarium_translucidae@DN379_c0_g1_i1.p4